jgi:mycofactocin system transcriptional regulator
MADNRLLEQQGSTERRPGRQPATSHSEIEHVAFQLFERKGFEQTTIDDIASAVGIARRTFFRYFPSKNDIAWGTFDAQLEDFEKAFQQMPAEVPMMDAIRQATLEFNQIDPQEEPWHRLILETPALQAYSTLRYRAWRDVVARFAATRTGVPFDSLTPQAIGYASLGIAVASYEAWLAQPGSDLLSLLDVAFAELIRGFAISERA